MKLQKWIPKRVKVPKSLAGFNFVAKSADVLKTAMKRQKTLKKVIQKVFTRRTVTTAAAVGAVSYGVSEIMSYIRVNSGCFLKSADFACKVKSLSCCQKETVHQLPFCDNESDALGSKVCENFNEDVEKSCCRLCDCNHHQCLPGQTMECLRPTVAEAITHFAGQAASDIMSGIQSVFPWLSYVFYAVGAVFLIWILMFVKPLFSRLFSRRKQDD